MNTVTVFAISTYLCISAVGAGVNAGLSFHLLAVVSATPTLARVGSGVPADHFVVILFACQLFATNVSFVAIAIFTGISNGATLALLVQPFARMGPIPDVGVRIGMGLTVVEIGVITGSPMSGAILDGTGSFKDIGYVGGCTMLLLSAVLMVASRYFLQLVKTGGARGCD